MKNREMEYLSDEELMKMIQDTESQEMLVAPVYLKSEILTKIGEPDKKAQSKKKTLMIYRFKVAAVATAAIFALFLMPMGNARSEIPQNEKRNQASVTRTINERTNSFCNSLFELSNGIISPQDNRK